MDGGVLVAVLKGGDKLNATLANLAKKIAKPATLRVGFLEGATYPDGTSVPMIAAFNEFGAGHSPPRPFFRNMIAAKSKEWGPAIAKLLEANDYDAIKTLELTGEAIKGQLVQSINDLTSPPLKPVTIKRKGFDKPLIDTSVMVNSVDYEVNS
jgi:hypothetical protein